MSINYEIYVYNKWYFCFKVVVEFVEDVKE